MRLIISKVIIVSIIQIADVHILSLHKKKEKI